MVTQVTDDVLSRIEGDMATKIEAMSSGPYFYKWGSVNEEDRAKQIWPSAEIRLIEEVNLDEEGGAWSNAYMNVATYEIWVRATLEQEVADNYYAINERLNRALHDLKKCFGINYSLAPCGLIMYQGMRRESERTADSLMPVRMITSWRVQYTQERSDPTNGGDG